MRPVSLGVRLARTWVEALLGLALGVCGVADTEHLDVRLVDLFEHDAFAIGREPEATHAVELLLRDELGHAVRLLLGASTRDGDLGALAVEVEDANVVVAYVCDALSVGREVRVERAVDRKLAHGARHAVEDEEVPGPGGKRIEEAVGRELERREARRSLPACARVALFSAGVRCSGFAEKTSSGAQRRRTRPVAMSSLWRAPGQVSAPRREEPPRGHRR